VKPKSLARVAGLLYLALGVLAGFAQMYVRPSVLVAGDATATANNIRANATLFRVGLAADVIGAVCFLFVAIALYFLLRSVSPKAALTMLVIVGVSVAIECVNMVNHAGALVVATDGAYSGAMGGRAADGLALLFLDLHKYGVLIAQVFFGLWLLPLGYLVYRSGWFPKALGVLLAVACFFYLVELMAVFATDNFDPAMAVISAPAGIAEIVFAVWLTAKGLNARGREQADLAAA